MVRERGALDQSRYFVIIARSRIASVILDSAAILAVLFNEPLLFKGNDFSKTDVRVVDELA